MEVEAVDEGVLGRILVRDGTEGVKVNEPIAVLVEPARRCRRAAPRPRRRSSPRHRHPRTASPPPLRPAADAARGPAAGRGTARRRTARRRRGRAHLCFTAGAADGGPGRHRAVGVEGQRSERPHRAGGHRGRTQKGRPPAAAPGAGTGCPRPARTGAGRCDQRTAPAGAAQFNPKSDRAPADRGEIVHSALLYLDGHRDRRADRAARAS